MTVSIESFFDPATWTLTYVIFDPGTRDAVVIDPVLDFDPASGKTNTTSVEQVERFLVAHALKLHLVLETHAHADHLSGAQYLKRRFGAPIAIGERVKEVQASFKPIFGMDASFATDGSQFDRLLVDGERVTAGSLALEVIATPGHTPACSSYLVGDALFTGDALFMDDYGTGRCDFPKGDPAALYHSVHDRLYRLPEATRVYVGHDYQPGGRALRFETSIGSAKANNSQLKAGTSEAEFVKFRSERDKTLSAPRLLFPSVQVNIDAGRLPRADAEGRRWLQMPINLGIKTLDDGTQA
jgi:glyoxylase-like metal-dependent hydrolase (beta-lactamase superfamily II)